MEIFLKLICGNKINGKRSAKLSLKEEGEVKKEMCLNLGTIMETNISMQVNTITFSMLTMNRAHQKPFPSMMEPMLLKQQKSIAWEKD